MLKESLQERSLRNRDVRSTKNMANAPASFFMVAKLLVLLLQPLAT